MTRRSLAAGGLLALLAVVFAVKAAEKMPDFEVYWRAGARAAAAEPLYRIEDQHYQFKYLPAFAVLAIPASALPLPAAKAVWFAASVGLLGALLVLSLRLIPAPRRAPLLVGATIVVMAKFYGHELVLGQVNLLFAVMALLAVHAAIRGRSAAAGLLVAATVIVKPYAIVFLPWLAARRDVTALVAAGAGLAAAAALPAIVYGVPGTIALHADWWRTVTDSTAPNLLNADNVSLAAMYAKWLGIGTPASAAAAITGMVLLLAALGALAMRGRVASPDSLEAGLLLTLVPLLSPQGWDYVFLVATPAVMLLVHHAGALPQPMRAATIAALALVGLSLYDLMGRAAYRAFMMWSIITVCFLVVTAALLVLRGRRVA